MTFPTVLGSEILYLRPKRPNLDGGLLYHTYVSMHLGISVVTYIRDVGREL